MKNIRNFQTRRSMANIQKQLHEAALAIAEMHSGELFEPQSTSHVQEMMLDLVRGLQAGSMKIDHLLKITSPLPIPRKLVSEGKNLYVRIGEDVL